MLNNFLAYCQEHGKDPIIRLYYFAQVLAIAKSKGLDIMPGGGAASLDEGEGGPVITCDLCRNAQWWIDTFGEWLGPWSRWWWCGPLNMGCPGDYGDEPPLEPQE